MSTVTSVQEVPAQSAPARWITYCTTLEVLLIFSGIMLYIWRWEHVFPWAWMLLWAAILASHFAHHDTFRSLGLTRSGLRSNAEVALPLAVAVFVPMLVYGFLSGRLTSLAPSLHTLLSLLGYGVWCLFQQYLTQSYFHNRLMTVTSSRHASSLIVGLMFGAAHIPNPILMVATTIAGFIFGEIFARHRNIWPLALVQAVGGFLLGAISPASLIHNMRVGPGYFFYHLR